MSARPVDTTELLAQMGWVQGLARSLVRDPNVAADVAQQAWLVALERPPHTATSGPGLRAWLASVTRTLARQSVRGETRRSAREQRAARAERAPEDTLDVVARGEVQKALVAAVMELDEPYRATVLHRYLDGLSAPEIAERMDATPAAVRKRLSRGLATLRQRLDAAHDGDCRVWLSALLPLAVPAAPGGPGPGPAAGPGAPLPAAARPLLAAFGGTPALTLVLAAALVLLSVIWWLAPWEASPAAPVVVVAPAPRAPVAPSVTAADLGRQPAAEQLATTAADALAGSGWQRSLTWTPVLADLSGQVLDTDGAPVPELRVRLEPLRGGEHGARAGAVTRTVLADADGRFRFEAVPEGGGRVLAASSRWVTVFAGDAAGPPGGLEPVLVVAPRRALAGRVSGPEGQPVPGARLRLAPPDGLAARFGGLMASSWPLELTSASDDGGRFVFERAANLDGALLEVSAPGFRTSRRVLAAGDGAALTLVLARPARRLSGRVLDGSGAAVADAVVGAGAQSTRSAADGGFTLWFDGPGTLPSVTAVAPGRAPRVATPPTDSDPAWLELRLDEPALSLAGQVLDARGRPVPHAAVWVADPTLLAAHPGTDHDGAPDSSSFLSGRRPVGAPLQPTLLLAEALGAGVAADGWWHVRTDRDGRFLLPGLASRPYTVRAQSFLGLARVEVPGVVPAGQELLLRLPAEPGPLRGRVVDLDGRPLADVQVSLQRAVLEAGDSQWFDVGASARSDATGHFELERAAREGTLLELRVPGALPLRVAPPLGAVGTFVLPPRCDLRVLLADPGPVDAVAAEDAAGQRLPLVDLRLDRLRSRAVVPLWEGSSEVLSVSATAVTLVLLADGQVHARRPLQLSPGQILEIH